MSQAFLIFDFGKDEDAAQRARHRLEGWRQGFRLGDKLELRFERTEAEGEAAAPAAEAGPEREPHGEKKAAGKKAAAKKPEAEKEKAAEAPANVRLYVRLGFSNHEKLSYQRWLDRIPSEEPFKNFPPTVETAGTEAFQRTEELFESLKHGEAGKQRSR
jgi:hypothetical protein